MLPFDESGGRVQRADLTFDDSHAVRSLLVARSRLVSIRRDLENQVRGLLTKVGLLFPRAIGVRFRPHVLGPTEEKHVLRSIVEGLLDLVAYVEAPTPKHNQAAQTSERTLAPAESALRLFIQRLLLTS